MQTLKTIWRVENEDGEGPFSFANPLYFMSAYRRFDCEELYRIHEHPREDKTLSPHYERLKGNADGWCYGFESLEGYARWFPNSALNTYLIKQGFLLKAYTIASEHVLSGDRQCVFYSPEAQLICCDRDLG